MKSTAACSVLLLLAFVGGCGTKGFAPVSGTVTLDGKPLPNASVNFQPLDSKQSGQGSVGKTDADGRYSLRVVVDNKAGAVVGKHRVSISSVAEDDPEPAHVRGASRWDRQGGLRADHQVAPRPRTSPTPTNPGDGRRASGAAWPRVK
jgi:hypothetical protein